MEGGGGGDSASEGGRARRDVVMSPGSGSEGGMVTSPLAEEQLSPTGKGAHCCRGEGWEWGGGGGGGGVVTFHWLTVVEGWAGSEGGVVTFH